MRFLAKILAVFLGLLLLLAGGLYWYLSTLDISEYREEIAAKVKQVTGRELRLAGEMDLRVFPSPSLVAEDVSLSNAGWASQTEFARIKRVEAEVSLADIFAGKVTLSRIAVLEPTIVLETDERGRNNWTFGSGAPAESAPSDAPAPLRVDVSNVEIRGGQLLYLDGTTKRRASFGIDELLLTAGRRGGPMLVDLKGNAAVSNVPWGSHADFVSVGRIEANLTMSDWSGSDLKVARLVAERPVVFLETDANGRNNWTFGGQASEQDAGTRPTRSLALDVGVVEVRDGQFSYRDGTAGTTRKLAVASLQIKPRETGETLDMSLRARVDERAFSVNGTVGSLSALLDNRPFSFDVKIDAAGAEIAAGGRLQKPIDLRGVEARLALRSPDLGESMGVFGIDSGLSLPVEAMASVRDVDEGYLAENLKLTVGKSDLSGDLSYALRNGRPLIKSALQSKLLDLDDFSPAGAKKKSGRVIPGDPLPVDALRSVDADISFMGARVVSAGMEVSALTLDLVLRNGRLELTPTAGLYGGEVKARVGLDAAGERPRLRMELKGQEINLGALVNAAGQRDVLSGGPTSVSLKLDGHGNTPREIAASASGLLVATVGPGKIHTPVVEKVGADAVMQVVRAASGEGQSEYTGFECGVARFEIEKGKAVTKRGIAVQNVRMNVVGSGTVDLGTEALDIAIKTEPREGAGVSVGAVGLAVRVGGTLASPKTSVDPLGAAKAGASAAAAFATGGLSLLGQALFSRASADDTPCETALGIKKAPEKQAQSTSKSPSKSPEQGAGASPAEALKGVGDAIKGLFGN